MWLIFCNTGQTVFSWKEGRNETLASAKGVILTWIYSDSKEFCISIVTATESVYFFFLLPRVFKSTCLTSTLYNSLKMKTSNQDLIWCTGQCGGLLLKIRAPYEFNTTIWASATQSRDVTVHVALSHACEAWAHVHVLAGLAQLVFWIHTCCREVRIDLVVKTAAGLQKCATSLKMTQLSENYFDIRVRVRLCELRQRWKPVFWLLYNLECCYDTKRAWQTFG